MAKRTAICKLCSKVFDPPDLGFCDTCGGLFCDECEGLHKCNRIGANGAVGVAVAPKVASRMVGTQIPATKAAPPRPKFEIVAADMIPTMRCCPRDMDPDTLAFLEAFKKLDEGSAIRWPLTLDPKERSKTKSRIKNHLMRRGLSFGTVSDHEWLYVWPKKKPAKK